MSDIPDIAAIRAKAQAVVYDIDLGKMWNLLTPDVVLALCDAAEQRDRWQSAVGKITLEEFEAHQKERATNLAEAKAAHERGEYGEPIEDILRRYATEEVTEQRDKLQAFKDWVHNYLDAHGVPHHPPGTHGAAGCRIGDRMDWLMAELATARAKLKTYQKLAIRAFAGRDRQIAALRKALEPFAAPGKPPHNILASVEQLEAYRVWAETATDAPKEGP